MKKSKNSQSPKSQTTYNHEGHKAPLSRREFLAQSTVAAGMSCLWTPSLLSLLIPKQAWSATPMCELKKGGSGRIPMLCIDMSGGWNAGGNFLGLDQAGNFLNDYGRWGLGNLNPKTRGVNQEAGIAMPADSPFLAGLKRATASKPEVLSMMDGFTMAVASNDDTGNNLWSPLYMVAKSGTAGALSTLIGTEGGISGGRSSADPRTVDLKYQPTLINGPQAARSIVQRGLSENLFGTEMAEKVQRATASMSTAHLERFNRLDMSQQIETLLACGVISAPELAKQFSQEKVDPVLDPQLTNIFPRNGNDFQDGRDGLVASAMKFLANGYAGAGVVTLGGYDYHDGSANTWVSRDDKVGELVGKAVMYANAVGSSIMFHLYSDGAINCDNATQNVNGKDYNVAKSDGGGNGLSMVIVYDHNTTRAQAAKVRAKSSNPLMNRRIGWVNDNGVDRNSSVIANNVGMAAQAVFLNYLELMGDTRFASITGTSFGSEENKLKVFQKIV